jgi:hypothetical protein
MGQAVEQRGRHFGTAETLGHSPKASLVVTMIGALVEAADEVEQELAASRTMKSTRVR